MQEVNAVSVSLQRILRVYEAVARVAIELVEAQAANVALSAEKVVWRRGMVSPAGLWSCSSGHRSCNPLLFRRSSWRARCKTRARLASAIPYTS